MRDRSEELLEIGDKRKPEVDGEFVSEAVSESLRSSIAYCQPSEMVCKAACALTPTMKQTGYLRQVILGVVGLSMHVTLRESCLGLVSTDKSTAIKIW